MDQEKRPRSCHRYRTSQKKETVRGSRQICIAMTASEYEEIWSDATQVRQHLDTLIEQSPELFPAEVREGYHLSGHLPESKKLPGIRLRQLQTSHGTYTLRPSFVMSYMSGTVSDLEYPLLLLSFGVPCWVVTMIYGRNEMYWHRHLERLGRNSLVGTTVPLGHRLPSHLVADEHHADWCGEKGYVAFTAGDGCILGLALSAKADENHLRPAYDIFAQEARALAPDYQPETVTVDGWIATRNVFVQLFTRITPILCFLHGFLSIRDRSRKEHGLHQALWEVYHSDNDQQFRERMTQFWQDCQQGNWSEAVMAKIEKFCHRVEDYALSYQYPGCHRTSNLVDRLMNRLTRYLYDNRGIHGHLTSSERRLRGWALLQNFRPFAPRSGVDRPYQSPAHRLNQKQYHAHWLHNLQFSASLAGKISCT